MRRNLFFWFERLKITRTERLTLGSLMGILLVLMIVNVVLEPASALSSDAYSELDKAFKQRSNQQAADEKRLLARYAGTAVEDTLPEKSSASAVVSNAAKVDINSAGLQQLQQLPGIGPAYARHIVVQRQSVGGFSSPDDLLQVKGIGPARLQKILPMIMLGTFKASDSSQTVGVEERAPELKKRLTNTARARAPAATGATPINVNTAGSAALQTLPGIGPAYAGRIIAYRSENGAFKTKEELLNIKGIGKKRLAKMAAFIKLTDSNN